MSFTIRNATVKDASVLFKMTKEFHDEMNMRKQVFTNTLERFTEACFDENSKIKFIVTEFKDQILGYCIYVPIYNILTGDSLISPEVFIKKEYRKIGISVFLFSKLIDAAYEKNSYQIKWLTNLLDTHRLEVERKAGVKINKDVLVLSIYKESIKSYLNEFNKESPFKPRFVKSYELPDVFGALEDHSKEENIEIKTDIYKLMSAAFSSDPKFKMFVVVDDDEVIGFISFYESYSPYCGRYLISDYIFVKEELKGKGIGQSLISKIFEYAYENNFTKVESTISKYEVEKIEQLKEFGIYPYDNLRVATYEKEVFNELYNK